MDKDNEKMQKLKIEFEKIILDNGINDILN
jgi:hypothetical protein